MAREDTVDVGLVHDLRAGLAARVREAVEGGDEPEVVADTVLRVARAAAPKVRYTSGALAARLRLLRRFAPAVLVEAGVRSDLRLASQPALRKPGTLMGSAA